MKVVSPSLQPSVYLGQSQSRGEAWSGLSVHHLRQSRAARIYRDNWTDHLRAGSKSVVRSEASLDQRSIFQADGLRFCQMVGDDWSTAFYGALGIQSFAARDSGLV